MQTILFLMLLAIMSGTAVSQTIPLPGNWECTLNEGFKGTQLNTNLWNTRYWFCDVINNEEQAYVPENVIVENDVCKFIIEKRNVNYCRTNMNMNYASGIITSFGKFTQTYGYFEASIKMPTTTGLLPAFCLWPERGVELDENSRFSVPGTADSPGFEIDIMEYLCEWTNVYHVAIHWCYGEPNCGWGQGNIPAPAIEDGFHTFGVHWDKDKYDFYYDGIKTISFTIKSKISEAPQFIMLNCAAGGDWPSPINDSALPDVMEIDWVRAWREIKNTAASNTGDREEENLNIFWENKAEKLYDNSGMKEEAENDNE